MCKFYVEKYIINEIFLVSFKIPSFYHIDSLDLDFTYILNNFISLFKSHFAKIVKHRDSFQ